MTQTTQNTMKAAALDRFGGIETITLQTLPVPDIGADEVLIRIESAGVGVWDAFEREGGFAKMFGVEPKFPYVLGSDGAGTVSAVGEQANRFKEDDRVYAAALINPKGGFYAQYIAIKSAKRLAHPRQINDRGSWCDAERRDDSSARLGRHAKPEGRRDTHDLRCQRRNRTLSRAARQANGCPRIRSGFGR